MKVIHDLFNVLMPLVVVQVNGKGHIRDYRDKPEKKNTTSRGSSQFKKGECCGVAGIPHRMDNSEDYLKTYEDYLKTNDLGYLD